jgi:acetyl-CoA carboxylase beta subunit
VRIYNINKNVVNENYIKLINNTYFQKSIKHVFDNLKPKSVNITHKVSEGETFNKILNSYQIPKSEVQKIINILSKENKVNKLKANQIIKFTIDKSENNKIISLLFPVTRTKKIELTRNSVSENFKKEEIITNLNKKIIFKEGKILQSLYKTAVDLEIQASVIIEFARL